MIRRAAVLALLSCLIVGCSAFEALAPAPAGTLTIEVRSGPSIDIRIGTRNVARLECGVTAQMTPGARELPPLPWDMTIVSNRDVRWTGTVANLPMWVLVTADGVVVGDAPPAGPNGPPCPL